MTIDQTEALDWIDKLREAIPEEIKQAKQVNSEVERLLENARHEAGEIMARGQQQATYLIEERELTRQAEEMGREIIRQAQVEANEVKRGADEYAAQVLAGLEQNLMKTLKSVKLGLDLLDGSRMASGNGSAPAQGSGEVDEYESTDGREPVRG